MTSSSPRVAITGLGTVTAAGLGRELLAEQLRDSRPLLAEVEPSEAVVSSRRRAALVTVTDFRPWLTPLEGRRMSRPSRLAVVAARIALADAGLTPGEIEAATAAVGIGTSFGPSDFSQRILDGVFQDGPEGTSPALFTESVANAPAAQVALAVGAKGANVTVTQREASAWIALGSIAREVASGRSQVGLAGSVDEVNPLLHALLGRFGALAGRRGEGDGLARPFDRRRDGFLLSEGATVLVLEGEARVRRRGVRPLAWVRLTIGGFDPSAPTTGWSDRAQPLATRLAGELERHGIGTGDIDGIVSTASGSRGGDRLEGRILRAVWGTEALPTILAPKGVVGEYGGSHLAAAILAAAGWPFGETAGFSEIDPEIGIVPHTGGPIAPPARVLATSLAAGGAASWTVLEAGGGG
jgi:3-oxoacyl-[acyl-carrier-protein] synthase II